MSAIMRCCTVSLALVGVVPLAAQTRMPLRVTPPQFTRDPFTLDSAAARLRSAPVLIPGASVLDVRPLGSESQWVYIEELVDGRDTVLLTEAPRQTSALRPPADDETAPSHDATRRALALSVSSVGDPYQRFVGRVSVTISGRIPPNRKRALLYAATPLTPPRR